MEIGKWNRKHTAAHIKSNVILKELIYSFLTKKKSHQNQTKTSAERLELLPTAHLWTHSLAVNTDKYFMCFRVLPVG